MELCYTDIEQTKNIDDRDKQHIDDMEKQSIIEKLKKLNDIQFDILKLVNNQNENLDDIEEKNEEINESLIISNNVLDNSVKYKSNSKGIILGATLGGTILCSAGIPVLLAGWTTTYTIISVGGICLGGYIGKKIN